MSRLRNMGFSMTLGKDERKYQLEQEIHSGKTLTVSSCAQSMGLSKGTIRTYLKELNISIYDDELKDMSKIYNDDTKVIYPF